MNRDKGNALLREGKRSEAMDCFQKSVDISPEMALALIKVGYRVHLSTADFKNHGEPFFPQKICLFLRSVAVLEWNV